MDLRDLRFGLQNHDDLDAIGERFAENTDVRDVSRIVKVADVFLDDLLGIRPAHPGAHIRQDLLLADRARAGVLHFDRSHDGPRRGLGRGL